MTQPPYEQYPGGYPQPPYQAPQYQAPQYPAPPQYQAPQYQAPQYPASPQYQPSAYPGHPYPATYPPQPTGTNGFAVASLIFGIIGGVLLSVIFGIIALVQIPKRGQRGKGLAVSGLVLSTLWVLAIVVGIIVAVSTSAERDASGDIVEGGSISVTDLKTGDCFNGLTESGTVVRVDAVPCAEPHDAEVFAVFDLTGSSFPGDAAVFDQAETGCNDRLEEYSTRAIEDDAIELYIFHPTQQSWSRGDHEVTCIIGNPNDKITGSLKD